jgi:hypothetical protein
MTKRALLVLLALTLFWPIAASAQSNVTTGGLTSGKMPYASGTTAVSDSGVSWDSTNSREGVGTTSPDALLHVNANSGAVPAPRTGTLLHVTGADSAASVLSFDAYGSNNGAIDLRRSAGTGSNPSALSSGDNVGQINWFPYGSTGFGSSAGAAIRGETDEAQTDSAHGMRLLFRTTSNGATSPSDRMTIKNDGKVGIGTTSPSNLLDVRCNVTTDVCVRIQNSHAAGLSGFAAYDEGGTVRSFFGYDNDLNATYINSFNLADLILRTAGVDRLKIDGNEGLVTIPGTFSSNLTTTTVSVTGGDASDIANNNPSAAGVSFPLDVLGLYTNHTIAAGSGTTSGLSWTSELTRDIVTLGNSSGGVGKFVYQEYTGSFGSRHQEYYGVASLQVIDPSSSGCSGGCAFNTMASQTFIKATTDATATPMSLQVVNTATPGAGGVYGLQIVNGVDGLTNNLVKATAAVYIGAKQGSSGGVESWDDALVLQEQTTGTYRARLRNDGTLKLAPSTGSPLDAFHIAAGSGGNGANIKLSESGQNDKYIRNSGGSFQVMNSAYNTILFSVADGGGITTVGSTGVSCSSGINASTFRSVNGIVTSC